MQSKIPIVNNRLKSSNFAKLQSGVVKKHAKTRTWDQL